MLDHRFEEHLYINPSLGIQPKSREFWLMAENEA
jgi:hypothetical protein